MIKEKHEFAPVYNEKSKILILGSFPSVKSREEGFYYGHPMNRFWKVISTVLSVELPLTIDQKKDMLLKHHIALWDVIEECEISGSSDSSIKNVTVNDFTMILKKSNISCIITNGATAGKLYQKYAYPITGFKNITLPSTSPANAAWSLERLVGAYTIIKEYIKYQSAD